LLSLIGYFKAAGIYKMALYEAGVAKEGDQSDILCLLVASSGAAWDNV
jgi:hypothetical protein